MHIEGTGGSRARRSELSRALAVYLLLVIVPVAGVVFSLRWGGHLSSTGGHGGHQAGSTNVDVFARLLVTLPVVLAACRLLGLGIERLGQPAVMGEIVAGVLLGPSLLGWLWPAAYAWLFPAFLTSTLNALAQLGLIMFMFLVGYELDLDLVRRRGYVATVVSHVSIALPFLAGVLLALGMYTTFATEDRGFVPFALFLAASMSVTAFPVLARILTDRGMTGGQLGALALACAAVADVSAWSLLAGVTAIVRADSLSRVGLTFVLAVLFFVGMMTVVRPVFAAWLGERRQRRDAAPSEALVLTVILGAIMLAAGATDAVGIHPIFGAFLLGAVMPRRSAPVVRAVGQMSGLAVTFLTPLFFVYTGLHTKLALLGARPDVWAWCAVVTCAAVVSKWAGSTLAARATGLGWPEATSLGALMNCRGLTELVVLNVGLSLGVITMTVFAILLVMTLVSTFLTAPSLTFIERRAARHAARATAAPALAG